MEIRVLVPRQLIAQFLPPHLVSRTLINQASKIKQFSKRKRNLKKGNRGRTSITITKVSYQEVRPGGKKSGSKQLERGKKNTFKKGKKD